MKQIIAVQHCQSQHHLDRRMGGWFDSPLTEEGRRQARAIGAALAPRLAGKTPVLLSSDLLRARQTAEGIAEALGIRIHLRESLREQNFGQGNGRERDWYRAHRAPLENGLPTVLHRPFPDAETGAEVYQRVCCVADEIASRPEDDFIVVGHGGSIQMFAAAWLKLPLAALEHTALQGNAAGVSVLGEREDGARVLHSWNDTSLAGGRK